MSLPSLVGRTSPWVVVTGVGDPWVAGELTALRAERGVEYRLNARELAEPAAVFRAFARELSFPGYFGYNWDALADCLRDLHVSGHDGRDRAPVAVVIDGADVLQGVAHLGLMVSVFCQAAWAANLRLDADGLPHDEPPFALHFVLLLDELSAGELEAQVGSGRDVAAVLSADGRLTATLAGGDWPGAD